MQISVNHNIKVHYCCLISHRHRGRMCQKFHFCYSKYWPDLILSPYTCTVTAVRYMPRTEGGYIAFITFRGLQIFTPRRQTQECSHAGVYQLTHNRVSTHTCHNWENAAHVNTVVMKYQERVLQLTFINYNNTVLCIHMCQPCRNKYLVFAQAPTR
jgi:hypothetical protein